MKYRDNSHFPEKNIYKETLSGSGTVTPDLNVANIFRIVASSYDLTVANPTNVRDGQYIRIEVISTPGNTVNFGTGYHVNGAVIADSTHNDDFLVIYEGFYNADTSKVNLIKLSEQSASTDTDILTFVLAEQTGAATVNAVAHTVDIEVGAGTTVTALEPTITLSSGATVDPESGEATNFTSPVTYTVTAEDTTTEQEWTVTVTVAIA